MLPFFFCLIFFYLFSCLCLHIHVFHPSRTLGRINCSLLCSFSITFLWNSPLSFNLNSLLLNPSPPKSINFSSVFNYKPSLQSIPNPSVVWITSSPLTFSWPSPNYFVTILYTEMVLTKEALMTSSWTNWVFFHLWSLSFLAITLSKRW